MRYVKVCSPTLPQINALVDRTLHQGMPRDAVEIYRGRNILAWIGIAGEQINIKAFHAPRFINKYIYGKFRPTKAKRSYENARHLLSLGFGTPEPFAYAEEYCGLKLRSSYYFSRQISAQELRYVENRSDCRPILEALAGEMVRLHQAGVLIKDFSPGNVLFNYDERGGYTFAYVDLNRIEFGVTDRRRLMANFSCIVTYPKELRILADAYARKAGLNPQQTVAEATRQHAKYLNRKKFRVKIKKGIRKLTSPWKR